MPQEALGGPNRPKEASGGPSSTRRPQQAPGGGQEAFRRFHEAGPRAGLSCGPGQAGPGDLQPPCTKIRFPLWQYGCPSLQCFVFVTF